MPPGPLAGLAAQLALLAALAATVGTTGAGWVAGAGYGLAIAVALARGMRRRGVRTLGPADRVTLLRSTLVGGVAALVAHPPVPVPALAGLSGAALLLDAVDGRVARRTGTASPLGARLDMEVDASLILILSVQVARSVGIWVLAIGAARYAFGAAGAALPWLRRPLPPRYWRKVVAAIQGIVLAMAATGLPPRPVTVAALVVASALLAESFGRDVWWLWRHRDLTVPAGTGGTAPLAVPAGTGGTAPLAVPAGPDTGDATGARAGRPTRPAVRAAVTLLAALLTWCVLLVPDRSDLLTPAAFARLPVEALLLAALVTALPARAGRVLSTIAGLGLGLLAVLSILDVGMSATLDRRFNPVTDLGDLGPAVGVLGDSVGRTGAAVAAVVAALLAAAIPVLTALALRRLAGTAARHRRVGARAVVTAGLTWVVCAATGAQLVPGTPVASTSAAPAAYAHAGDIAAGIRAQRSFARAAIDDPWRDTPGADLLTGLRGRDVLVVFVESYGRVAVQDSPVAPGVDAVLSAGTAQLGAAGYSARSAFLTSPTFGGTSWLAHSTLQSGMWVDSQQQYDQLMTTGRVTLAGAFHRAGWRTVGDVPSNRQDWPPARGFYHYDAVYDARNVGYHGPTFGYGSMPDQFVLDAFGRRELARPHPPVMAEIDLVSSHWPWAPLPSMVDWNRVGDGSVFDGMPAKGRTVAQVWRDPRAVRAAYGQSIEYSLNALFSFVRRIHDRNLTLVVLGDHQPSTAVTGPHASHDVPVSIISADPAVTDRIAGWGWQDGMLPGARAPVWRMDAFRDRFLTTYGSLAAAARH